eukprot:TRINITY_DN10021_c0_g1_i4.p1 TRINITY_DN10021_c0_g1~~TRINITY_DN10021_c0_g1_i4.p1  ORF type:complete len:1138 (+),score=326.73 TRINITY_DN10021_c0_g1_i4:294-3707(+)
MDFRKLGWKKKSSEKNVTTSESSESVATQLARQNDEQATKLEEALKAVTDRDQLLEEASQQLQDIEERNKVLSEKLTAAISEASQKENLVKQHAKVAEEAVSGWEKAEAEALASKQQVESLTKQNFVLEDRISHLDGALKECMRQLRHVKEENEHRLHETILNKNRELDRVKLEFQSKRADLENHVLQVEAENDALSRSLQERNHSLVELNDARAEAEAQINVLQVNIEQYQKENASLSFEIQVLNKSLEIRTEEKNISMKSAEAANKQHLEDVKKITKLEAECQRLRSLLRKKLPGPAALAQMKLEAEYGKDSDVRKRRSPLKSSASFASSPFDSGYNYTCEQGPKESAFLTERLLAMEEETKMLKEALAKRNSELQASRSLYSKSQFRISYLEKQLESYSSGEKQRKPVVDFLLEGPRSHSRSNPPSLTSMSEDGNDDEVSCTESWSAASATISGLSEFKKEKGLRRMDKPIEPEKTDLMEDFEEMERLTSHPSLELESTKSMSDMPMEKSAEVNYRALLEKNLKEKESELESSLQQRSEMSRKLDLVQEELIAVQLKNCSNETTLTTLQTKLNLILEKCANINDTQKVLEIIKSTIIDAGVMNATYTDTRKVIDNPEKECSTKFSKGPMSEGESSMVESKGQLKIVDTDLDMAFSKVVCLLEVICRKARNSQMIPASKLPGLNINTDNFVRTVNDFLEGKLTSISVVNELFSLLSAIAITCACASTENNEQSSESQKLLIPKEGDCSELSDKENPKTVLSNGTNSFNIQVDFNNLYEEKLSLESALQSELNRSKKLEEQLAKGARENDELRIELTDMQENLKQKNNQLFELESTVKELQKEVASLQESMQLAEHQSETLASQKAELETHLKRVEVEKSSLHEKIEYLMSQLEEKHKHQAAADSKCRELTEQLQRKDEELAMLRSLAADNETKENQEREIAAAAEKLAECQRTIDVLGRQLKTLKTPGDSIDLSNDNEDADSVTCVAIDEDTHYPNSLKYPKHQAIQSPKLSIYSRDVIKSPSRGQSASVGSGSDIIVNSHRKKTFAQTHNRTLAHNGDTNIDDRESHSRRPSLTDTETSSPAKSPTMATHCKKKNAESLAGKSSSRSFHNGHAKAPSEKSGSGIGRFFSRKSSH